VHLVQKVIEVCKKGNFQHLNHAAVKQSRGQDFLVAKVPELIRTTFISATSSLNQVCFLCR
jgi:hypothetical protein